MKKVVITLPKGVKVEIEKVEFVSFERNFICVNKGVNNIEYFKTSTVERLQITEV